MANDNKEKNVWQILFIISMCISVVALGFIGWYLYQDYAAQKAAEELQEAVVVESVAEEEETKDVEIDDGVEGEEADLPENILTELDNPIDFATLQGINSELYAWIRIEDTNIDYPIAQREGDHEFYLHHDMYGTERYAGSIYTEDYNSKDFLNPVTVIYGHNMKNGSMFHDLRKYEDKTFFKEHPYVYIYTPDAVRKYEVFAAYTYDDRHLLTTYNFSDNAVYTQYLEDVQRGMTMSANLRDDIWVSGEDRIITLSTCVGSGDTGQRFLVQAVLIEEQYSRQ